MKKDVARVKKKRMYLCSRVRSQAGYYNLHTLRTEKFFDILRFGIKGLLFIKN